VVLVLVVVVTTAAAAAALVVIVVVMTMHFTYFRDTVPASEIPCTLRMTVSSDRDKAGCGVTQGVGVVALPSLELRPV